MIDTLVALETRFRAREAAAALGLEPETYLLVTLHRPALVDGSLLGEAMSHLAEVAVTMPVVFPVHPRTRKRLESSGWSGEEPGVHLSEPVGYLDFLSLEADAAAVLTDSGGIQEETTYLGVPCFTLRDNTERPVTVRAGTNTLLGLDPARIAEIPTCWRQLPQRRNVRSFGMARRRSASPMYSAIGSLNRDAAALARPRDTCLLRPLQRSGPEHLRAARLLREMLENWPDDGGLAREILLAEQEGDRITHEIIQRLNSTFVTPLDGEDIYGLATKLDDIVDQIEETADFMVLYHIEAPMEQAHKMAEVLVRSCEQLAAALENLRGFKGLEHYWIEIHRLENDGDRLYRDAVASLFAHGIDPMVVIRWQGHLPGARARGGRDRDSRPHSRGHRHQERVTSAAAGPKPT